MSSRLLGAALALFALVVAAGWIAASGILSASQPGAGSLPPAMSPGDASDAASTAGSTPTPTRTPSDGPPTVPPSQEPATATPQPLLDPVFGMSGHLMWRAEETAIRQLDMLAEDGLGVVRFDVAWRGLEPERGRYAYLDKLDRIVDAAVAHGMRTIVTIVETPGWANGGESAWVPPDDPEDYARFAGMLAQRYAGRVEAWEIWNEPDIRLFWRPDPDAGAYARLLIAASAAIRAADPEATIVGGSVTFGNTEFVRAIYDAGAKGTFDALSVHPYTLKRAPDDERDRFHSLTAILDDIHAVMAEEGDAATPLWITELGWAVVGLNSVSKEQRIEYMRRSVELIRERPWVEIVTMYTISTEDSARYGLATGGRRSDAWNAYVDEVRNGER